MVLEKYVPLLQQENKELRADEGIHINNGKTKTLGKTRKQMEGKTQKFQSGTVLVESLIVSNTEDKSTTGNRR